MRHRLLLPLLTVLTVSTLALLSGCAYRSMVKTLFDVTPQAVSVPTDAAALARGAYLVETVARCGDCHNADLGGEAYIDGFAMGTFAGPNLTPGEGSAVADYADVDWVRAIRHGIDPTGRPLVDMPADTFTVLTVEDLGAMIAYLKQLPSVDREPPATDAGPVGRMLVRKGDLGVPALTIDHDAPIPTTSPDDGAARGLYLARIGGCMGCHGEDLAGRSLGPTLPPATNLTQHADGLSGWSEADFVASMRQGQLPDGSTLDPLMPWPVTANLSDEDLSALWAFLTNAPATASQK